MHNVDTTLVEETVTARSFCPPGCPPPSRRAAPFFVAHLQWLVLLVGSFPFGAGKSSPSGCWKCSRHSQTRRTTCDNVISNSPDRVLWLLYSNQEQTTPLKLSWFYSDSRKFVCDFEIVLGILCLLFGTNASAVHTVKTAKTESPADDTNSLSWPSRMLLCQIKSPIKPKKLKNMLICFNFDWEKKANIHFTKLKHEIQFGK